MLALTTPLSARDPLPLQELRIDLSEANRTLNAHQTELDLLNDRLTTLERSQGQSKQLTALSQEVQALKAQLHATTADIASLKTSLHTLLATLKQQDASYTVQEGDSLGHIAHTHKTTVSRIKELNNLSTDRIYPGQKLTLP